MMATRSAEGGCVLERAFAVLEIDLGAIVANWRLLRAATRRAPTPAVVKADGYGLGAQRVAPRLYAAGCRHFFVAHLDEALATPPAAPRRHAGVLNGLLPGTEADVSRRTTSTPVLGSLDEIDALGRARPADRAGACRRSCTSIPACPGSASTGRAGKCLPPSRAAAGRHRAALRDDPSGLRRAARRPAERRRSLRRFAAACAGLPPAPRSLANSSGDLPGRGVRLRPRAARCGALRRSIRRRRRPEPDAPAGAAARAGAARCATLAPGETVGYNATWTRPAAQPHRHRGRRAMPMAGRARSPTAGPPTLTARPSRW